MGEQRALQLGDRVEVELARDVQRERGLGAIVDDRPCRGHDIAPAPDSMHHLDRGVAVQTIDGH